jgi:hypothetical protein
MQSFTHICHRVTLKSQVCNLLKNSHKCVILCDQFAIETYSVFDSYFPVPIYWSFANDLADQW